MSSGATYAYHWALVEWPDGKGQRHVQVVRTTKSRDTASEAARTWADKHLAPGARREATVRYIGQSDTRTRY